MSDKRANLEVIAPTVEEAVAKGLSDLGLGEDAVDVEVLDEGSRGLFGIGARQARVRLSIKSQLVKEGEIREDQELPAEPYYPAQRPVEPEYVPETARPAPQAAPARAVPEAVEEGEDPTLHVARETVSELLEKMKVKANISARFGEADDARSKIPILIDVRGNDLSILIGRQAETLNALQYIASIIIGKELGRSVPVVIDVEGYRMRREQQIRQLARRMADQAVKTGKRQVLEPMPANERRLIHLELRDHPQVSTESIGEDPRRKVTINPK